MSVVACTQISRTWRAAVVGVALLSLAACASQRTPEEIAHVQETNDPWEPLNRSIFAFNEGMDVVVFKPLAVWYTFLVPFPAARDTIRRVVDNASLPWTMINELFQGEWNRAGTTTTRFLINTTLGIGGMIDWATRWGYEQHSEDFGLTMARRFGTREGPYFVIPVLGPSNVRDTFGRAVDGVGDPIGWILPFPGGIVRTVVDGVDVRSRHIDDIEQLRRDSVDFYATLRSIWRQRRQAEVNRGAPAPQDIPRVTSDMAPYVPASPSAAMPPDSAPSTPARRTPPATPTAVPTAAAPERAPLVTPSATTQAVPRRSGGPALPTLFSRTADARPADVAPSAAAASAPIETAPAPTVPVQAASPVQTATAPWVSPQAADARAARRSSGTPAGAPIQLRPDGSWVVTPASQGR